MTLISVTCKNSTFECSVCEEWLTISLAWHLMTHPSKLQNPTNNKLQCVATTDNGVCLQSTPDCSSDTKIPYFQCCVCDMKFTDRIDVVGHSKSHQFDRLPGNQFKCKICQMCYDTLADVLDLMNKHKPMDYFNRKRFVVSVKCYGI